MRTSGSQGRLIFVLLQTWTLWCCISIIFALSCIKAQFSSRTRRSFWKIRRTGVGILCFRHFTSPWSLLRVKSAIHTFCFNIWQLFWYQIDCLKSKCGLYFENVQDVWLCGSFLVPTELTNRTLSCKFPRNSFSREVVKEFSIIILEIHYWNVVPKILGSVNLMRYDLLRQR